MPLPVGTIAAQAAAEASIRIGGVALKKIRDAVRSGSSISSLADLSRPARVEPIMIVDEALDGQPFMQDLSQSLLSIYIGYYVQGVSLSMDVGRIDTLKTLDSFNPNRSVGGARRDFKEAVFSKEAYAEGLPSLESFEQPTEKNFLVSVEDPATGLEAEGGRGTAASKDNLKLFENANMAVGKMVTVELKDGEHTAKLPVLVRLVPTTVESKTMSHIFTALSKNASWKERYHLWRAGQIRGIKDLMLQIDLIDEHKKALVNDTSNVYMTVHDRKRNNALMAGRSGTPSLADASNIAVFTKDTAREIEKNLYGKLSSSAVRKKVFDATYLLLLVIVDEKWERVTIYHRGLDTPTEASFRDLKSAEKGKGPDITEILQAYSMGATPSFP